MDMNILSKRMMNFFDRLGAIVLSRLFLQVSHITLFMLIGYSHSNLYARSTPLVLQNKALSVGFDYSDAGPRLANIRHKQTDDSYIFSDSKLFSLAILRPDAIHVPQVKVGYGLPESFSFRNETIGEDGRSVVFHFSHKMLRIDVRYELQSEEAVLVKTITCTADEHGAYLAGVRHWVLSPLDIKLAWPAKSGTFGQPAVLLTSAGGCLLTLEWPRAQVFEDNGNIHIEYRPGFNLSAGESIEVGRGSMVFFGKQGNEKTTTLETARRAFYAHITERVKPDLPFPVKFTTWGPWLTSTRADRILQVVDDLQYVGTNLLHFDAGWLWPDQPYTTRLPKVMDAEDSAWDMALTNPIRLPNGMLPIVDAAKDRNIKLSVWMDSLCSRYVRETEQWAILNKDGKPYYTKMVPDLPDAPIQALTSQYGERLKTFVHQLLDRYDLGGIMFDFHRYMPDYSTEHDSLANGWDSIDKQLRKMIEIYDQCDRRRPGIYRFYCNASPWPWMLLHATHIHAKDPGTTPDMRLAIKTDYPARALAFERRLAWQDHYDNFVPPWGIKGDIAGWSMQQKSAIPVNLKHTGLLIPSGEGWMQNMFTCFATTAVRDIRFSFGQMPQFDKDILKEWLAWDRKRTKFIFNCRPVVLGENRKPNKGMDVISHVRSGKGVMYIFNRSFDLVRTDIKLNEKAGFEPSDQASAYMVYPMKASLGQLSFGQSLKVPVIGKDCVVIEVGLERPEEVRNLSEYEQIAKTVHRSFQPAYRVSAERLFDVCRNNSIVLQVGNSPRDRRLAGEIVDTLGAANGTRIEMKQWENSPSSNADYRIIVGTSQGLSSHPKISAKFVQTLYNEYIDWNGRLYSAPLLVEFESSDIPTICLIAPRPEQLAQLSIDLTNRHLKGYEEATKLTPPKSDSFIVPANDPLLRFEPTISYVVHAPLPGTLEPVRFDIEVETNGRTVSIWNEEIPPFCCARNRKWWKDRVVSLKQFAGREVRLNFTAKHIRGPGHPDFLFGFKRISILEKKLEQ